MRDSAISVLFKGRNAVRLLEGLGVTLSLSAVSVLLSILTGLILGFLMMRKNPAIRLLCRIWLEAIRIVPQLVLLFLVYFGAATLLNNFRHLGREKGGNVAFQHLIP